MCGITAYIGQKEAYSIVIKGLQQLEYRGYDSSGIALMNGSLSIYKKEGRVSDLVDFANGKKVDGNIGLGHTRWATHGKPSDANAHPHRSQNDRLVLVHNGIIENYQSIKEMLLNQGYKFHSRTDSEVLVQLIEWYQIKYSLTLHEATRRALQDVKGSYAIVVFDEADPTTLIAAKKSSPLAIGIAEDGFYLASDANPITAYTENIIYLEDERIVSLYIDGTYLHTDLNNKKYLPEIKKIASTVSVYDKGSYDTFMLKEIYEQPEVLNDCLKKEIDSYSGGIKLDIIDQHIDRILKARRIIIAACGTSWHSGLIAEYLIEQLAELSVEVEYASEFRYRKPVLHPDDIVIAISQSGETADTLAAIELAKAKGAFTIGIVNTVGSTIARTTDAVLYLNAGVEIGVASTKAFTNQVGLLTLLALKLGQMRGHLNSVEMDRYLTEFTRLPSKIEQTINDNIERIATLAEMFADKQHALFLGRGLNFPIALEGALKLKEISYIHAEGYPAAEMKHGPIALIDENMPVIIAATNESSLEKLSSNIEEVKARKGIVIPIVNKGNYTSDSSDCEITIPKTLEIFSPILTNIPMQLLAYHVAKLKGCNIDQPRNLAKSVTVE